jgi:AcrR family transcriptional regulator
VWPGARVPPRHGRRASAGELLHDEGPAAVSVRRVADAVGTTTRAVYSLFGDKDGPLREPSLDVAETMRRHHEAVPERDDPLGEIPELMFGYRATALEKPKLYDLFCRSRRSSSACGSRPLTYTRPTCLSNLQVR